MTAYNFSIQIVGHPTFDLDEYEKLRGLVIDFKNPLHTLGPKIKKLEEILSLKEDDFKNFDLNKSVHFFHKHTDGKSTERVGNFLIEHMKKTKKKAFK